MLRNGIVWKMEERIRKAGGRVEGLREWQWGSFELEQEEKGLREGERQRGTLLNVEKPHNWWCLISIVITIPLAPCVPNLGLSYIHATFRKWLAGPLLLPATHRLRLRERRGVLEFKYSSVQQKQRKSCKNTSVVIIMSASLFLGW